MIVCLATHMTTSTQHLWSSVNDKMDAREAIKIAFVLMVCLEAKSTEGISLATCIRLLLKSKALQNVKILHVYTNSKHASADSYQGKTFIVA